jgi:hypothetical protein
VLSGVFLWVKCGNLPFRFHEREGLNMKFQWKGRLFWVVALVLGVGGGYLHSCSSLESLSKSLQPVAPEVGFAGAHLSG